MRGAAAFLILLALGGCADLEDWPAPDAPRVRIVETLYSYGYVAPSHYRVRQNALAVFVTLRAENLAGTRIPLRVYSAGRLLGETYFEPGSDDVTEELGVGIPVSFLSEDERDHGVTVDIVAVSPWSQTDFFASHRNVALPLRETERRRLATLWQVERCAEAVDLAAPGAAPDYGLQCWFRLQAHGRMGRQMRPTLLVRGRQDDRYMLVPTAATVRIDDDPFTSAPIEFRVPYRWLVHYGEVVGDALPALEISPQADWQQAEERPDAGGGLWIDVYAFGTPPAAAHALDAALAGLERQRQQLDTLQNLFTRSP
jgi:hypothetical protein